MEYLKEGHVHVHFSLLNGTSTVRFLPKKQKRIPGTYVHAHLVDVGALFLLMALCVPGKLGF